MNAGTGMSDSDMIVMNGAVVVNAVKSAVMNAATSAVMSAVTTGDDLTLTRGNPASFCNCHIKQQGAVGGSLNVCKS